MKLLCSAPFLFLFTVIVFPVFTSAQTGNSTHQLKEKLKRFEQQENYINDTNYVSTLTDLAYIYSYTYPDSALLLLKGNAERCNAAGNKQGEIVTYMITGDAFQTKGMYDKALENYEKSYGLSRDINYKKGFALIQNRIGVLFLNQGNYPEALENFYESL
jgi:tetratricopeptide (TPR) repeat protein